MIKVMEREVHITSTDTQINKPSSKDGYEQLEMNLHRNGGESEMYRIS